MPTPANSINVSTTGAVSFNGTAFTGGTLPVIYGGTGAVSFPINGVLVSGATTTTALTSLTLSAGQIVIGATGAAPAAASLTAGTGISITPGVNSITIASTATGVSWSDQATSFAAAADHGYFITGTATATLPASPSEGDTINFAVDAATVLTITANTGQFIRVGTAVTLAAGTCVSTARGDSLTLTYRSAGLTWLCIDAPQGVWVLT